MSDAIPSAKIGMMQGRMVPSYDSRIQCFPRDDWREDFKRVAQAGFQRIEWLYDHQDAAENPISTEHGLEAILALAKECRLEIASLCAHCFVERPIPSRETDSLRAAEALLNWLCSRACRIGIQRVVLPLDDPENLLAHDRAVRTAVIDCLRRMGDVAAANDIVIALETGFPPDVFACLLQSLPKNRFGVNYDTGNSAGLGYEPEEEFGAYGSRIFSVHIKDKKRSGGTVAPGQGNAPFAAVAELLERLHFRGDLVLEVARCPAGEELPYARRNLAFVNSVFKSLLTAERQFPRLDTSADCKDATVLNEEHF